MIMPSHIKHLTEDRHILLNKFSDPKYFQKKQKKTVDNYENILH